MSTTIDGSSKCFLLHHSDRAMHLEGFQTGTERAVAAARTAYRFDDDGKFEQQYARMREIAAAIIRDVEEREAFDAKSEKLAALRARPPGQVDADWPCDGPTGRFLCTPLQPKPNGASGRWTHQGAKRTHTGDYCDDYECVDCGATWDVELPE